MNFNIGTIARRMTPAIAALAILAPSTIMMSNVQSAFANETKRPSLEAQPTNKGRVAGRGGYQGAFLFNVPTGLGELFFHYPCPTGFVARSGGALVNGTGRTGMSFIGDGPRFDIGSYQEWFWLHRWSGGAPSGSQITFDVYCTKLPV